MAALSPQKHPRRSHVPTLKQPCAWTFLLSWACNPAGPGRGGSQGRLQGPAGYYVGQVLAAQPHGHGCLFTAEVRAPSH